MLLVEDDVQTWRNFQAQGAPRSSSSRRRRPRSLSRRRSFGLVDEPHEWRYIPPSAHRRCVFEFKRAFLDESGNSGANLNDQDQPVYCVAGFVGPTTGDAIASTILAQASSELRVDLGKELKGAKKLKPDRPQGWRFVRRVLQLLGESGCIPFLALAEKRFVIAAKIVETFLDPFYNRDAPPQFGYDLDVKQDTASMLAGLPEGVLERFAVAYRKRDAAGLASALAEIILDVQRTDPALAAALGGAVGIEGTLAEAEASVDVGGAGMGSLNLPMFVSMIDMLETVCGAVGAQDVTVVHDESREFAPVFSKIYGALRNATPALVELSNGSTLTFGYRALTALEFRSSETSPGIQLADLIAASARVSATAALRGKSLCADASFVGGHLMGLALVSEPKVATLVISSDFATRVVGPLVRQFVEGSATRPAR
ncbi:MAG TPA: DUF3800 domain-containing protein [Kofleriaceae bacterium]|nr:DUF3800 domain-containing protein [Kofleriaceae bacterium]